MKRIIALLLAVLLLMSMAACSRQEPAGTSAGQTTQPTTEVTEPSTQEVTEPPTMANDQFDPEKSAALIGTWKTTLLLNGKLLNFADMEGFVEMELLYTLNADGTYTRGVEEQVFKMDLAAFESLVENYMMDSYYTKFAAEKKISGWGEKRINEEWEATEKAVAQQHTDEFLSTLNLSYRFTNLNRSGDYYEQDGKLCFSKTDGSYETCSFTLEEGTLTLTDTDDLRPYRQMNINFPITLTKG
ncbi:MAG: hypothetical protein IJ351_02395 [Oscillospiraceae bacterium]|nr:hypothetical protein [Oscillospiraceae bacterium]